MASSSAKIPAVSPSEYETPHVYRHGSPYYPSPPPPTDQVDEMQISPRRHGRRPYYPSPLPPTDQVDEMQIPRRHKRPCYPSPPPPTDQVDEMQIPPRRHGRRPYYPSPPPPTDQVDEMQIPRRHSRPYYPSEPPGGKIDPRRHGREQPSDDDYDYDHDYQPKLSPFMNGSKAEASASAAAASTNGNGNGNGNGHGNGNGYAKKNSKKAAAVVLPEATLDSDESALIKKLQEIHAHDGAATFHTEPLLKSIRGILDHLDAAHRFTNSQLINNPTTLVDNSSTTQPTSSLSILDTTLPSLLHKITCMLNCKCGGGGDGHALALEILELVANYAWDVKIAIVLAAFAVEFGQYGLVTTLYNSDNELAKFLASLMQTRNVVEAEAEEGDADYMIIRSKMETVIRIARLSIEVTNLIAKFGSFPSKHIAPDAEPILVALNQIPISVYWMIRVVIACASEHSQIQGHTQIITSYSETWSITSVEEKMDDICKRFTTQYELCQTLIEEKIEKQFYEELKDMFSQTTMFEDNQRIFQAIFNTEDNIPPLSGAGSDQLVGVGILKTKTVLLLISDLSISKEEIAIISELYKASRESYKESSESSSQYEIVWVPIVKLHEQMEEEEIFKDLKGGMPWYVVEKPNLLKPGFVRYVRKKWNYSKKAIMVALDQSGSVVHKNALHMMITWGNAAHPFTYRHEYEQWNSTTKSSLSLQLLQDIDTKVSSWVTEKKVICLYGGNDYYWIRRFIELAREVAEKASIELGMVYISNKVTTKEHIARVTKISSGGRSELWSDSKSAHFWKRIESMKHSKAEIGAKGGGDVVSAGLLYMSSLGESKNGWAVISGGVGDKVARATGDAMSVAFDHFDEWKTDVVNEGFTAALSAYLAKRNDNKEDHRCTELEDIPGIVVCSECGQPMERRVTLVCSATRF